MHVVVFHAIQQPELIPLDPRRIVTIQAQAKGARVLVDDGTDVGSTFYVLELQDEAIELWSKALNGRLPGTAPLAQHDRVPRQPEPTPVDRAKIEYLERLVGHVPDPQPVPFPNADPGLLPAYIEPMPVDRSTIEHPERLLPPGVIGGRVPDRI